MKVAMYYRNSDIRIEEMPVPEIGNGELLVKVMASGICGSDVMEWYRLHKAPLVLGHEIAGEIVEVGERVKNYKAGDRIAAAHHVPCNECHFCLSGHHTVCDTLRTTNYDPGGFSQYLRLPKINVRHGTFKIPDSVTYDEATFIEPLACVLRGQRQAGLRKGQRVLVIGSGISGLLHVQMAKLNGASAVFATDLNELRLSTAKKFGADGVFHAEEDRDDIPTVDVVILCAGAELALRQAFNSIERAGTILFFAPARNDETLIPAPVNKLFWRNEITLTSSYAGSPKDHIKALKLIRDKKINVNDMITHRLPLKETQVGFKLVEEAKESIKVIIHPHHQKID